MENTPLEKQSKTTKKFLGFQIGTLNLALPVESVSKVIPYTTIHSSGLNELGIIHVGNRDLTVVDLYRRLFKTPHESSSSNKGYFVLTINSVKESFAIWVPESPSLLDILLSNIRVLPESYRRRDSLEIATHVALFSHLNTQKTIFLLDADALVPPLTHTGNKNS